MVKQLLLGSMLGGLALFAWLSLSWAVLPFHMKQFHAFPDQENAQTQLRSMNLTDGIYILPDRPHNPADAAEVQAVAETARRGPTVTFMIVQPAGYDVMDFSPYLKGLGYSMLAAACGMLILIAAGPVLAGFSARWRICVLIGVAIALAGPLTSGAFFMYPAAHLALEVIDHIAGWALLGLVLAWAARPAS